jgi:hypothetical protein
VRAPPKWRLAAAHVHRLQDLRKPISGLERASTARLKSREKTEQLQIFKEPMPNNSKYLWFQRQAFPKNVLAVLWNFNGLSGSKSKNNILQIFCSEWPRRIPHARPME